MPSIAIDYSTSGTKVLVAGVPNRKIRVMNYVLMSGGTVNPKFTRGSGTELSGPFPMVAQSNISSGFAPSQGVGGASLMGHFDTDYGEDLNLVLDQNVQVSGHLSYALVV